MSSAVAVHSMTGFDPTSRDGQAARLAQRDVGDAVADGHDLDRLRPDLFVGGIPVICGGV